MKNKKGKPSKVQRKTIPLPKPTPLPKEPRPINPKLENVRYNQPKKGKYIQPSKKTKKSKKK